MRAWQESGVDFEWSASFPLLARARLLIFTLLLRHPKATDCIPPGLLAQARPQPGSARGRDGCGLQQVLHHVFADLASHILADAHREPVVKAGPDAGVRHLFV